MNQDFKGKATISIQLSAEENNTIGIITNVEGDFNLCVEAFPGVIGSLADGLVSQLDNEPFEVRIAFIAKLARAAKTAVKEEFFPSKKQDFCECTSCSSDESSKVIGFIGVAPKDNTVGVN